ncbi:TIGR01621 family pseudouridine synthase [Thiomicrorhabdus hydrogeniphila]
MISIIYQNNDFVVVDKPAGLNFHSEELPGLVVLVKNQLALEEIYPVHRLDKMTSGILILAKHKAAAQAFQLLFETHQIEKFYIAVSHQKPKKKQGWVKGDMLPARRGSWKLTKTYENPAITQFISESIQPGERLFLLKPKTGKTHQIRVAMKSLSAPICGDERYADSIKSSVEERGYLHAFAVRFTLFNQSYHFVLLPCDGSRFTQQRSLDILQNWQAPWDLFKS